MKIKIIDVKVHVIKSSLEIPFAFSQGWVNVRSATLVEIKTNSGLVGWGEAFCQGLEPPEISAACLLYTSPSPRDGLLSRMPSSA